MEFRPDWPDAISKFASVLSTQSTIKHIESVSERMNSLIVDSIQDIKGKNILKLNLTQLDDAPTDYFIICEGDSTTQVQAISENIRKRLKEDAGQLPLHVEGLRHSRWVCLDYFTVVVHIFHKDVRSVYELEDLWGDAEFTFYDNL